MALRVAHLGVPAFAISPHFHMNIPAIPTIEPLVRASIRLTPEDLT